MDLKINQVAFLINPRDDPRTAIEPSPFVVSRSFLIDRITAYPALVTHLN